MDADYADDIAFLANTPTRAEFQLHLNGGSLKLEDKFMYLGSSISSTESDISMCLVKPWTAIDRLSII